MLRPNDQDEEKRRALADAITFARGENLDKLRRDLDPSFGRATAASIGWGFAFKAFPFELRLTNREGEFSLLDVEESVSSDGIYNPSSLWGAVIKSAGGKRSPIEAVNSDIITEIVHDPNIICLDIIQRDAYVDRTFLYTSRRIIITRAMLKMLAADLDAVQKRILAGIGNLTIDELVDAYDTSELMGMKSEKPPNWLAAVSEILANTIVDRGVFPETANPTISDLFAH